jgi:hypothetical protein
VDALLNQVTAWKQAGITPFAFTPPLDAATHFSEIQNEIYIETELRKQFTEAGGVWLDTDQPGYETSDGSHLVPSSAIKLSRELARQIQAYFANR